MNPRKRLKKEFEQMEIPSKETVLPHRTKTVLSETPKYRTAKKRLMTAPLVVVMAMLFAIGAAAAGGIILSRVNAKMLTGNHVRLTEVPEGYVGIYTIEDLIRLNESLKSYDPIPSTHYILMNDLTFTEEDYAQGGICEGGWDGAVGYMSSFWHMLLYKSGNHDWEDQICFINGNGHVIRNLKINVDANEYLAPDVNRNGVTRPRCALFVGLFTNLGRRYLQVINLGIEGCEINIKGNDIPIANHLTGNNEEELYQICVGAVASTAEYLGGCYVNGLTLNLDLDNCYLTNPNGERYDHSIEDRHIYGVGSVVGYAQYVDACYAENVEMNISVDSEPFGILYAGGIAGHAKTCLTSWSSGQINAAGSGFAEIVTDEIVPEIQSAMIPQIIPEDAFNELKTKLVAKYGEDSFAVKKILVYFTRKDIHQTVGGAQSADNQVVFERWNRILNKFSGKEEVIYDVLYLFDPTTSPSDTSDIVGQIIAAFESEEAYRMFCAERNIMLGQIYCYSYAPSEKVTEERAPGFDFETLWTIRDGRPKLKIFEN